MNKTLALLLLLAIPTIGFCDTLDYWHVYLNDSVIAKFNATSQDLNLEISKTRIKDGDIISIRHGDDTPCVNCKFVLFVRDQNKRKLRITETEQFWGKLSFDLIDLIEFGIKNKSKRFDFYFWEKDENGKRTPMKLILKLKIK